jgi:hypothetical protein
MCIIRVHLAIFGILILPGCRRGRCPKAASCRRAPARGRGRVRTRAPSANLRSGCCRRRPRRVAGRGSQPPTSSPARTGSCCPCPAAACGGGGGCCGCGRRCGGGGCSAVATSRATSPDSPPACRTQKTHALCYHQRDSYSNAKHTLRCKHFAVDK